jgi:hypothetical protein
MLEIGKSKILSTPCLDGVASNSDLSTQINVPSGGTAPILDSDFEINGALQGDQIISAKLTGVNLFDQDGAYNSITSSIKDLGTNKFDITLDTTINLNTTDRYSNVLPTIIVSPINNSVNWNSYDYCDFYVSKLVNPPTGSQLAALFTAYDNLINAGILQKAKGGIWFIIGGNAADHALNGVAPFTNRHSGYLQYVGSPTHDSNGITTNGTTSGILTRTNSNQFELSSQQISIYKRNTTIISSATAIAFGFNLATSAGIYFRPNINGTNGTANCLGGNFTVSGAATANNGLLTVANEGNTADFHRNGTIIASGGGGGNDWYGSMAVGFGTSTSNAINNPSPVDCSYIYHGEALSDLQEIDHYNIIQALQVAYSRNV